MNNLLNIDEVNKIISLCYEYKIPKFNINNDGTLDVYGNVTFSHAPFTELPLKFRKVDGDFYCGRTQITTLKGSPKEVRGDFYCQYNKLTSLEYFPEVVTGEISYYTNNNLPEELDYIQNELSKEDLLVFIKYYTKYDVFDDKGETNVKMLDILLDDIKEGLR